MTKIKLKKIVAIMAFPSLLTACGGGDSASGSDTGATTANIGAPTTAPLTTAVTPPATPAPEPAPATPVILAANPSNVTLGQCFTLKPGIKFQMTDGRIHLSAEEPFRETPAFASVELRSDGLRSGAYYETIQDGFVNILGTVDYSEGDKIASDGVLSPVVRYPVNLVPGESVQNSYLETRRYVADGPAVARVRETKTDETLTFLGLETLSLNGNTFKNVCKLKIVSKSIEQTNPPNTSESASLMWFLTGFGVIQSESLDAQGAVVPGSRSQLTKILAIK